MARTASKREEVCRSAASSDDWGLGAKTSAFIQDLQSSSVDLGGLPPGASSQEARKLTLSGARDFGTSRRHSGRSASPVGSPIPVDLVRRNYEVNVFLPLQLTQGVVQRWVREGKAQGKKVAFTSSMGGCSHRRTGALPQPRRARVHDVDVHRTGAAGVLDCLDAFFGGRSALIDQYPRHSAIPSRTSIAAIRPIIESLANVCKFALLRAYARRPSWLIGIRFGTL